MRPGSPALASPAVTETPPALPLRGIVNLRDVGGQPTRDGRQVRTEVLFRSGQLDRDDSVEVLSGLGLSVVFDLRGSDEIVTAPDLLPDGVELVHLDVLAGSRERIATHLADLLTEPATGRGVAAQRRGRGALPRHLPQPGADRQRPAVLRRAVRPSAAARRAGVVPLHRRKGPHRMGRSCTAHAARRRRRSRHRGLPAQQPAGARLVPARSSTASRRSAATRACSCRCSRVTEDYLQAARDAVAEHFGDVEGWFREGLGLPSDVPDRLRARLLV